MRKQAIHGIFAVMLVILALIATGCVDDGTPKYIPGDIIAEKPTADTFLVILDYNQNTDEYKTNYISKVAGEWRYILETKYESWEDRDDGEGRYPVKIDHVDLTTIMSWDEHLKEYPSEEVSATPSPKSTPKPKPTFTPTPVITPSHKPTPETKTWHSVITFTGNDDKTTSPFTIKGDEWRIKYVVNPDPGYSDISGLFAYVFPRGKTQGYICQIQCQRKPCSDTEYIYQGNGDYYLKVLSANCKWELEVQDYY